MYKKQIGQQTLFLLSVFLCSYFFVRVDSLQCLKTNYARAWHCNCLHRSILLVLVLQPKQMANTVRRYNQTFTPI